MVVTWLYQDHEFIIFPNICNLIICNFRQLCQNVWKTRNGQNRTPGSLVGQILTVPCFCALPMLIKNPARLFIPPHPPFSMPHHTPYLVSFLWFPAHHELSTAKILLSRWAWNFPWLSNGIPTDSHPVPANTVWNFVQFYTWVSFSNYCAALVFFDI